MSAEPPEGPEPVGLIITLAGPAHRLGFLVDEVARLAAEVAMGVSALDLGADGFEVLLDRPDAAALTAWLSRLARDGRVAALRAATDRSGRSDGLFDDPGQRHRYRQAQYRCTAGAVALLNRWGEAVPASVIIDELRAVHRQRVGWDGHGAELASLRWHRAWLRALGGEGPWPELGEGERLLAARVAHGQWLRLRGGQNDRSVEIDTLSGVISTLVDQGAEAPPA